MTGRHSLGEKKIEKKRKESDGDNIRLNKYIYSTIIESQFMIHSQIIG